MEDYEPLTYTGAEKPIEVMVSSSKGTLWMSQDSMAILFGRNRSVISRHLKRYFEQGLGPEKQRAFLHIASSDKPVSHYDLDAVIHVGKMVKSDAAQKLSKWLDEYLRSVLQAPNQIAVYSDGVVRIDVMVSPAEDTVWLTQSQIAKLFDVSIPNVSMHIKTILHDGELDDSVVKDFLITASDGKAYSTKVYGLDMILSVGYRVKSKKAIAFRRWADSVLRNYLIHGYAVDDRRIAIVERSIGELASKVISLDRKMEETGRITSERLSKLESLASRSEIPPESIFYAGQFFDAREFFLSLFSKAEKEIIVVDPYADAKLLSLLTYKRRGVEVSLVIGPHAKLSKDDIDAFNSQYGGLSVRASSQFHDRFAFIDLSCYHIGASFNHMGKKAFTVMKMLDQEIITQTKQRAISA